MIIQFKNRKKEKSSLQKILDSTKFEFVIIYGRRRIGKTELILNSTKEKQRIYYLATGRNNLQRFYQLCSERFEEIKKLKQDWEIIMEYLAEKVEAIIIDEFQNLIKEDENILNIFQSMIDQKLKNTKVKLFILGSSVSMISSKVLSYQSPLYGRRTGSMKIKPISFYDLKEFFPKFNYSEILEIYGFGDGIPYYLTRIKDRLWQWLEKEAIEETTFLRDEIDFLMRYEFTDISTYKTILEAIAFGKTKINEIKDHIKISRTDISPYLRNLMEVGFIHREVPITENIKSRYGRYFLSDNFLRFWFRFILPNLSQIEEGKLNIKKIQKEYSNYLGLIFEEVCSEFITKTTDYGRIGRWWHKEQEIDIVALDESNKKILFGECKWQDNVNAEKILQDLKEKAKLVQWNNENRKEEFAIFARSFRKKAKGAKLFDLKDIEKLISS